jgi:hypothetical protein
MTIADQCKAVRDVFKDWSQANAGQVEIAKDIVHVFGMLTQKPGTARAVVVFRDEVKRGVFEETGMVDRKFWVVVSQGRSLKLQPADQMVEGSAGGKALYDLTEDARDVVRGISFEADTTEVTPDFKGIYAFEADGWLIAANYIEFTIGTILPGPE